MLGRNSIAGNSAAMIRMACSIAFLFFTFCNLYFYQADIIFARVHALTDGRIIYNRTLGALSLTAVSYLIFRLLAKTVTLIPERLRTMSAMQSLWVNLLIITALMVVAVVLTDSSDVVHYRARMERLFMEGRTGDALKVGKESSATDKSLSLLRIYALAHEGLLGERLFEYPAEESLDILLSEEAQCLVYPKESIIKYLRSDAAADYELCNMLLRKDLDAFANEITQSRDISKDPLPKHYKEALILYTRSRSNPRLAFRDEIMEADYEDMKTLEDEHEKDVRASYIKDVYGNTYWYYHQYGNARQENAAGQ